MKHFTLEEATAALAAVAPLARRMVEHRRRLAALEERLGGVRHAVSGNGGGLEPTGVEALEAAARDEAEALGRCVASVEGMGAQVKDLDTGLVDFPAVHPATGETVLLCWRVGEDGIQYWHGLEEGFAGRKPLPF
jgi:hypothetical protein